MSRRNEVLLYAANLTIRAPALAGGNDN